MTAPFPHTRPTVLRGTTVSFVLAVLAAALTGGIGAVMIAAIAHAAGASDTYKPLKAATFLPLTLIGVLAGAAGWQLIRSHASHPGRVLGILVPGVVLVSFVPDIAVGMNHAMGATWGAVIALMLMHLIIAVAAVSSFRALLPTSLGGDSGPLAGLPRRLRATGRAGRATTVARAEG